MRSVRYVAAVDEGAAVDLARKDIAGITNDVVWAVALHPRDIVKSELRPGRMIFRVMPGLEPDDPLWEVIPVACVVPPRPERTPARSG